jgi:hypothetical protein
MSFFSESIFRVLIKTKAHLSSSIWNSNGLNGKLRAHSLVGVLHVKNTNKEEDSWGHEPRLR